MQVLLKMGVNDSIRRRDFKHYELRASECERLNMTHISLSAKLQQRIIGLLRVIHARNSLNRLKQNRELWSTLTEYLLSSESTGCSYSDYWVLYDYIREHKPKEILECGTGVTTVVMAYALMENEKHDNVEGRITSMEDQKTWYQQAVKLMPRQLEQYVDFVHSTKREYCYSIFLGVGYQDIPDRTYDFVFIDGPGTTAPSDGTRSFDFDYINVVMRSDKLVFGIIYKRLGTCFVLQKVFGVDKLKYDPKLGLGFVGPCTKKDIRSQISSESFLHCIRVFGKNDFNLRMGL